MLSLFLALSLMAHPSAEEFRKELGIEVGTQSSKKTAHLILVQHGSTSWSEIKRLQGWKHLPLSEEGKKQAEKLNFESISAIYTSSLQSAVETSQILQKKLQVPVILLDELKGEYHGQFEGYTKEEYTTHPHFKIYDSLSPEEELFYPCGLGGESKADVARRAIPAIKAIAAKHIGENVVIVTHGGVFKLLNYYLGNYSEETGTQSIPYGDYLQIEGDANHLFLFSQN